MVVVLARLSWREVCGLWCGDCWRVTSPIFVCGVAHFKGKYPGLYTVVAFKKKVAFGTVWNMHGNETVTDTVKYSTSGADGTVPRTTVIKRYGIR